MINKMINIFKNNKKIKMINYNKIVSSKQKYKMKIKIKVKYVKISKKLSHKMKVKVLKRFNLLL